MREMEEKKDDPTYNGCIQCTKRQDRMRHNHFDDVTISVQRKSGAILEKAHAMNRNLEKRLEKEIRMLTKYHEHEGVMHERRREEMLRRSSNLLTLSKPWKLSWKYTENKIAESFECSKATDIIIYYIVKNLIIFYHINIREIFAPYHFRKISAPFYFRKKYFRPLFIMKKSLRPLFLEKSIRFFFQDKCLRTLF